MRQLKVLSILFLFAVTFGYGCCCCCYYCCCYCCCCWCSCCCWCCVSNNIWRPFGRCCFRFPSLKSCDINLSCSTLLLPLLLLSLLLLPCYFCFLIIISSSPQRIVLLLLLWLFRIVFWRSRAARQLVSSPNWAQRTLGQSDNRCDPLRNMSCTRLSSSACQLVRFFMPVFVFVFIICQAKLVSVTPKMTAKGGEGDWSDENSQSKAKPQVMW